MIIPSAKVNEASKSATASIRACYADSGTCSTAAAYVARMKGTPTTALRDFIVQTGTTTAITVTPVKALDINLTGWFLTIVQTPTDTTQPVSTFDGIKIIVQCTIASIPNPTNPTTGKTLTYTLYDPTLKIDFSNIVYTQSPPCEWPVAESFTFTIPGAAATVMS